MKEIVINNDNLTIDDIDEVVVRTKGLIINDNDEIMLGYSSNVYQFPGGHLEEGEELIDTINREIKEETGMELNLKELTPFAYSKGYYKDWPSVGRNKKVEIYYYEVKTDEKPNLANTNYTEKEKAGNFELRYIPLDKVESEIISNAEKYEDDIIIEDLIEGREFSVGILDNNALPLIEIIPKEGFYDYKNKYQPEATIEICPADLSSDMTKKVQEEALKVHNALGLGYYSRMDFIVDKDNNIYCLEANTLPGMTPTSLLPREAKEIGISFEDLCEQIVLSTKQ